MQGAAGRAKVPVAGAKCCSAIPSCSQQVSLPCQRGPTAECLGTGQGSQPGAPFRGTGCSLAPGCLQLRKQGMARAVQLRYTPSWGGGKGAHRVGETEIPPCPDALYQWARCSLASVHTATCSLGSALACCQVFSESRAGCPPTQATAMATGGSHLLRSRRGERGRDPRDLHTELATETGSGLEQGCQVLASLPGVVMAGKGTARTHPGFSLPSAMSSHPRKSLAGESQRPVGLWNSLPQEGAGEGNVMAVQCVSSSAR